MDSVFLPGASAPSLRTLRLCVIPALAAIASRSWVRIRSPKQRKPIKTLNRSSLKKIR